MFKGDIEPQEVFLDNLARKKEEDLGISEKKFEVPLSRKKLYLFTFFIGLLILFFAVDSFIFQIVKNKKYLKLSEENKFIIQSIQSTRGVIYDSDGEQLAFNMPSFNLVFNGKELPDDIVLEKISKITDLDIDDIKNIINESKGKALILESLDHSKLVLLETKSRETPGFEIEKSSVRNYKDGEMFSHLIGYTGLINEEELKQSDSYTGFDYIGRDGIEKTYEEVLRRNPGKFKIERDVLGNEMGREIISMPGSGGSLVLWLDADLQRKMEQSLRETLDRTNAEKAVGVAIDPRTGGVLAMVNIPSYDNNIFSKKDNPQELEDLLNDKEEPLFNRVSMGKYVTGSIIKPLLAVAALEEKLISPDKIINCTGNLSIPHRYDPEITYDFGDWRIHGPVDMRKAIAESCNIYFYTIGGGHEDQKGLGPSKIKEYLTKFGWSEKTGIDLPNESEGFIPYPEWKKEHKGESWYDGDTYNLSIGQGDILITPLQVVTSFGAIANGGVIYKPKIVKEIVDSGKNVIETIEPEIKRQDFVNPDNLQIAREGMRHAVTAEDAPHASSKILNSLPVTSAAKTGTAQTPYDQVYHNWITVFAPYENPEIVMTLMIENAPNVQAAVIPTAKDILQWYFSH